MRRGLLINFGGVFLGAGLAYLATVYYGRRETHARRALLFRMLSDQLHGIPDDEPPYDPTVLLTRSTVHISAAKLLLTGDALDARKDALLIRRLVIWQTMEASFNESVRMTNQALVTMSIPAEHRATRHESLNFHQRMLIALRNDVLAALPPEFQSSVWSTTPGDAKGQGLLIEHPIDSAGGPTP